MPILDPCQQFYLIRFSSNDISEIDYYQLFLHFLPIASERLYQNLVSLEDYSKFANFFSRNFTSIYKSFGLTEISTIDLKKEKIDDFFYFFYKLLKKAYRPNDEIISDLNFSFDLSYITKISLVIIPPISTYSQCHCWFFTDSSFAILKISNSNDIPANKIFLEALLFKSLGLTLVLICEMMDDIWKFVPILDLIKLSVFSEIHLNFNENTSSLFISNFKDTHFSSLFNSLFSPYRNIYQFYGYFYLYFTNTSDSMYVKKYKSNPYCTEIAFSVDLEKCLSSEFRFSMGSFSFCFTGSKKKYIRISIFNVPIYDTEKCLSPSKISRFENCFVEADDFIHFKVSRVKVLFSDFTTKYVDFNDLHVIKPELYVNNMLYLMKNQLKSGKILDDIKTNTKNKINENQYRDFKKENIFTFFNRISNYFDNSLIPKTITYLSYAISKLNDITLRNNQLFTIYESCTSCLFNKKLDGKGIVYQLETGEGKSITIRLIAALLASQDNYVHIVSSNIYLSKRDYSQSYDFYNKLGFSSSVLLHKNELNDDAFYESERIDQKCFKTDYFKDECFENKLEMNFCACGFDNYSNKIDSPKIVYSTFVNLEAFYLNLIENIKYSNIEQHFKKISLIIDEADSILIDDLTNGTIISRPVPSNGDEVLPFIYQCKMGMLNLANIKKIINFYFKGIDQIFESNILYTDITSNYEKTNDQNLLDFLYNCSKGQLSISLVQSFIKNLWPLNYAKMLASYNKINKTFEKKYEILQIDSELFKNLMLFLCRTKMKDPDSENLCKIVKFYWPNSSDLTTEILNSMYEEIELVQTPEFVNGKKYSIQQINEDNKKFKQKKVKIMNGLSELIEFYTGNKESDNKKTLPETYQIVPFDYNNKGILENNKEFSGYIQQFIAIKEMMNNPEMKIKIKEMSLNQSFVTHPILAKLYKNICGFTGTIGNKNDRQILKQQYDIDTLKIPRNQANHRVQLPIILCNGNDERNNVIVKEVLSFNQLGNPVLVILQDLNEIQKLKSLLMSNGIKKVNTFDHNKNSGNPENIVGLTGEISLGTNFCGRGTDIQFHNQPLHVIVSYYSRNSRVMKQAFGRTARNGADGTCRIICDIKQYIQPIEILTNDSINKVIYDIPLKHKYQFEYINYYQTKYNFLFNRKTNVPKINNNLVDQLRSNLNVNRMTAYSYKYPISMNVDTFLSIQAQKVFSLYNCPNCKSTWMLFKQYINEMINQSWAIEINRLDMKKINSKEQYENSIIPIVDDLHIKLSKYIPNNCNNLLDIFTHIFDKELSYWNIKFSKLDQFLDSELIETKTMYGIRFGIIRYSLIDESGSRIMNFDTSQTEVDSTEKFIHDPEIYYYKKQINGKIPLSITEKIDKLFNCMCKKIDQVIGGFTGLKLFLRRTLAGCEFGVCMDFGFENNDFINIIGPNCLFDKDPLIMITIQTKSSIPILAGILIIVLIYCAKICSLISNIVKDIIHKGISYTLYHILKNKCFNEFTNAIFHSIYRNLKNIIQNQIDKMKMNDKQHKTAEILQFFLYLLDKDNFILLNNEIFAKFGSKIRINKSIQSSFNSFIPHLFKVATYVFLCIVAFFMNFRHCKPLTRKYNEKKEAKKFDKTQNVENALSENYYIFSFDRDLDTYL